MDRNEFENELNVTEKACIEDIEIFNSRMIKILKNSNMNVYNYIVTMEELGELIQEISKASRDEKNEMGLLEEICDSLLCITRIMQLENISYSKVLKGIRVKMDRTNTKILKGEFK